MITSRPEPSRSPNPSPRGPRSEPPLLTEGARAEALLGAGRAAATEDARTLGCGEVILRDFFGARAVVTAPSRPAELGEVLEAGGIPVRRYPQASLHDLASELALGHRVVLRLAVVELGYAVGPIGTMPEAVVPPGATDALLVVGLDTSDAAGPRVVVREPWAGARVGDFPFEWFLEALSDARFGLVATTRPAPRDLPEMARFPYEAGGLGAVGGMPWAEFAAYAGRPDAWRERLHGRPERDGAPSLDDEASPSGGGLEPEPFEEEEAALGAET